MKWLGIDCDNNWHDVKTEMPRTTTDVEFLKHDGTICKGHIYCDMSGTYASEPHGVGYTWTSFDYYNAWRYEKRQGKLC